jgi:hypothetical protein
MATPSGQPRAGTAAIGPVVAGRWAQTPSACIPRPRLPSPTPNRLASAPRWPPLCRLMNPWPCGERWWSSDALSSGRGWPGQWQRRRARTTAGTGRPAGPGYRRRAWPPRADCLAGWRPAGRCEACGHLGLLRPYGCRLPQSNRCERRPVYRLLCCFRVARPPSGRAALGLDLTPGSRGPPAAQRYASRRSSRWQAALTLHSAGLRIGVRSHRTTF